MYYDFDFNKDCDFFENSLTIKFVREKLEENKHLSKIPDEVLNASIKLWAESIIKHNLDINMTIVDHLNLISEQNSNEVLNVIGKIIFKEKHERKPHEFQILREQGIVSNFTNDCSYC